MKFVIFFNVVLFNLLFYTECLVFRRNSHDLIIKFSKDFYKKLEKENRLEEYKKEKIDQIQKRIIHIGKHTYIVDMVKEVEGEISAAYNDTHNFTGHNYTDTNKKSKMMKLPKRSNEKGKYASTTTSSLESLISNSDIVIKERFVQFHVSLSNECNVLVNDTVSYQQYSKSIESIEHLILNNNVDFIDPKGVFADNANISLFVYNKKLNMFTVFFDENNGNKTNYSVEYDYLAVNLIKSQKSSNSSLNNNTFIWKFYNENFLKEKQNLKIEFYFSIDQLFEHENVTFHHNTIPLKFHKSIVKKNNRNVVKYDWNGELLPNEIIILNVKFPLYLEYCGNVNIDISMIVVGSIFIVFLILILYIILSQILKIDDY